MTAGQIITRARCNQLLLPKSAPKKDLLTLPWGNIGHLKHLLLTPDELAFILSLRPVPSHVEAAPIPTGHATLPQAENRRHPTLRPV